MIQTYLIEWDTDALCTLVVAEEALRAKASELRKLSSRLALKEYDAWEGNCE